METAACVSIITPWIAIDSEEPPEADPVRHALFQQLAYEVASRAFPWLLQIIESADGQILAMPGRFYISVPAGAAWIEIPELSAQLTLTPWVDETDHAH